MGHVRTKPQICKSCGSEKVRGSHNKFKCISEACIAKRKAYMKQYSKKHWAENKDHIKEKRENVSPERKAEISAYMQKYREEHKEEHAAWGKQHREKNADRINAQRLKYREANKEKINGRQADYYQRNREERLEYAKHFRDEKMSPYYKMWDAIVQRCTNKNCKAYLSYGLRGIKIHEEWLNSFSKFEEYINKELGPKPSPKHSLDRKNNEGHYEPGNIKWSSPLEQAHNKRNSLFRKLSLPDDTPIWYEGRYITLKDFSEVTGLNLEIIKYRYHHCADADYILYWNNDNRVYIYNNHKYNMAELSIISQTRYNILFDRIVRCGMPVEKAMSIKG